MAHSEIRIADPAQRRYLHEVGQHGLSLPVLDTQEYPLHHFFYGLYIRGIEEKRAALAAFVGELRSDWGTKINTFSSIELNPEEQGILDKSDQVSILMTRICLPADGVMETYFQGFNNRLRVNKVVVKPVCDVTPLDLAKAGRNKEWIYGVFPGVRSRRGTRRYNPVTLIDLETLS